MSLDHDNSRPLSWYEGDGTRRELDSFDSPPGARLREALIDPSGYRPTSEARDAVNVALLMGMPLLISGEPGSGKTQLGYAVAHELGLDQPDIFVTKSSSQARDLFYRYDAIRHFHAAQTGNPDVAPFLYLGALGKAIFNALPPNLRIPLGSDFAMDLPQRRTLVIVDEIDKAPRDFPNDLLYEFEQLRFRIPELGNFETPTVEDSFRPILFITTNAEQLLPDAFLRRCAFLQLRPPRGQELADLIERRFCGILAADHLLVGDVVELFDRLREGNQIDRPPSSAELLEFLAAILSAGGDPSSGLKEQPVSVDSYLPLLAKSASDATQIGAEITR